MEGIDHGRLSQTCRQICVQTERLVNRVLDREELTAVQAMKRLGMTSSTFYRHVRLASSGR